MSSGRRMMPGMRPVRRKVGGVRGTARVDLTNKAKRSRDWAGLATKEGSAF